MSEEERDDEKELRDHDGKCLECDAYACCEHDPCIACFGCLGLSWRDFL